MRGLEQFSHLWLIFQFDKVLHGKWQSTVRPPRLGGNQRVGVFASRATHRPNPLGLSKVELRQVDVYKRQRKTSCPISTLRHFTAIGIKNTIVEI